MGRICWAESLGNCNGKLTREHIVPVAAFDGATRAEREATPLTVVITDATGAQTIRKHPVKTFTTNTLCKLHNEALSPLAKAMKHTTKQLSALLEKIADRKGLPDLLWNPQVLRNPRAVTVARAVKSNGQLRHLTRKSRAICA